MKIRGSKLSAIFAGALCALCAGAGVRKATPRPPS